MVRPVRSRTNRVAYTTKPQIQDTVSYQNGLTTDHQRTLQPAPGTWHLAPGTWHLAPGTWHLAPGTWHLAPGTWLGLPAEFVPTVNADLASGDETRQVRCTEQGNPRYVVGDAGAAEWQIPAHLLGQVVEAPAAQGS